MPSPTAGKAALVACQDTALHTVPPLLAETLFLGFKGLGSWIVHRFFLDPERSEIHNQQMNHSVSHALATHAVSFPTISWKSKGLCLLG